MGARIPFTDLAAGYRRVQPEIDAAVARVTGSGWYVGGPEVSSFERAFAQAMGLPYAVGVANGTDAIALALRALGLGRGDHVVLPALSAYPTTVGVLQAEATPAYVDVDPYGLLDATLVEPLLQARQVRAILCVHLFGNCADVVSLRRLTHEYGVALVEDCAQAHGAARDGLAAGSAGEAATWSFYPTKNLGALGDAGAVTCHKEELALRLSRLRNYGQRDRYEHVERGFNSRLDPMQAAILSARLMHLGRDNLRRIAIGRRYDEALANGGAIQALAVPPHATPNRHLYPVLLPSPVERDRFQAFLAERGIETLIHYPIAMPDQVASDPSWSGGRSFPRAREICSRILSLPCHPELPEEHVEEVVAASLAWKSSPAR